MGRSQYDHKTKVLMLASVASMIGQFNMRNIALLQQMGYEVHVTCNFKEGNTCDVRQVFKLRQTLKSIGVFMHQWDCPREAGSILRCVTAYRQLCQLMDEYRFAWMHCHSPVGGVLARLAAHKRKIRAVYTAHGFHFYQGAPVKNWLLYYPVEKLLAYWTDVLITINREDYCFAKQNLMAGSIYYIPGIGIDTGQFMQSPDKARSAEEGKALCRRSSNKACSVEDKEDFCRKSPDKDHSAEERKAFSGQSPDKARSAEERKAFCRKYQVPEKAVLLLSVGELSRRKNHQAVLSVLPELSRQDVYYLVCGQGPCRQSLLRQAQRLGIAGRVRLMGFQENVSQAYRNADLFVFPSRQEGMPAALMEAMAAGLPCVVSDIRGNRELVDEAKTGIKYSQKDPRQLRDALERMINDVRLRSTCSRGSREKIKGYDTAVVDRRMKQIYARMEKKQEIRISVLLAVCQPRLEWLEMLFDSIHRQSLAAYEVLIMDDGSDPGIFDRLQEMAADSLSGPERVSLYRSSRNEGSNRTFEKLVLMAQGDYIAFCDQDDVWETEKLAALAEAVQREHAVMAYSDMAVIDENGRQIYPSMRKMRKWLKYAHGFHQTVRYLAENCTPGCSMIVRTDLAKNAVPFCRHTYCDQWVAAYAAAFGKTAFVDRPLVRYRRHGSNQTGFFSQISSRQDYYYRRVLPMCRLVEEMGGRGIHFAWEKEAAAFAKARRDRDIRGIWKYRRFSRKYAYFDLLMICLPEGAAEAVFRRIKKDFA